MGCDIDFGAGIDEILFPATIGALPVVAADVHLNKLLLQYADEAIGNRASRRVSVRSHVEDEIAQLLPHGKANASEIARRLGMSRRTLGRALSAEEVTFSTVLETLRLALAKRYLREKKLPVFRDRVALGLSRDWLVHACLCAVDRKDTKGFPEVQLRLRRAW